jgi:hypothetical protein
MSEERESFARAIEECRASPRGSQASHHCATAKQVERPDDEASSSREALAAWLLRRSSENLRMMLSNNLGGSKP